MTHIGDICNINGAEIEPVDCIIGGSPCQDLSIAGKHAGLAGNRSGLFMEQIRIIKEMRGNDRVAGRTGQFIRPRYMVWENVPGSFSANKGADFAGILEETVRIVEPEAPLFLYLKKDGQPQVASWATDGASLGVYLMRNTGESPNVAVESRLSQILEENPHPKYYLTPAACKGILRRAERRGKELPKLLKEALLLQSESAADAPEGAKGL